MHKKAIHSGITQGWKGQRRHGEVGGGGVLQKNRASEHLPLLETTPRDAHGMLSSSVFRETKTIGITFMDLKELEGNKLLPWIMCWVKWPRFCTVSISTYAADFCGSKRAVNHEQWNCVNITTADNPLTSNSLSLHYMWLVWWKSFVSNTAYRYLSREIALSW